MEGLQLIDYIKDVASIIEAKNIIFASKMPNNRICIYLTTKDLVDTIIESNEIIQIINVQVTLRRLVTAAQRIIISNVCPFITQHILEKELQTHGAKLVSPINFL